MGQPIAVRTDFAAVEVRRLARRAEEDVTTAQRLTIEGDFFAIHRVETPTEIDAAEGDAGHDATFAFFFAIFFFGLTGLGFPLLSYRFGRARDISRSDFG